jgi:hypothetical protein
MSRGAFTKSRAFLFSCVLLAAAPVFARNSTDVVVMKNGDRMTGQVKSLNAGILSVSLDYVNGTISVDWSEVAHLESSQLFVVLTHLRHLEPSNLWAMSLRYQASSVSGFAAAANPSKAFRPSR